MARSRKAGRLDQLEVARYAAEEALRDLRDERDEKLYDREAEFKRKIEAELEAEYGERIRALTEALWDAVRAETAERDRLAVARPKTPMPVGTRVVEWRIGYGGKTWGYLPADQQKPTGRVGVIEVWTSGSAIPANIRYRKPSIGSWVIRLLDKKGKPTKRYVESWSGKLPREWLQEGERPKAREE